MKGRIKRPEETGGFKLPEVGRLKTGYKDSRGYPKSTDYFIPSGKYAELFTQAYGDKPQTVQIVFWEDNPATMCEERYEYRDSNGDLYARGDGEIFEIWHAKSKVYKPYNIADYPDIMDRVHDQVKAKGWEVILTLRFILPKVKNIAGYWQFTTKGIASTIPAVRDTFDLMMQNRGSVRGVIFDLNVKFATSQKPGDRSRYPVVSLVPNQSEKNVQELKGSMLDVKNEPKKLGQ